MRPAPTSTPAAAVLSPAWAGSLGFEFQAMSSVCEIRLDGDAERDGAAAMAAAAQAAIAEVRRIEQKYSRYRADSIVSRINAAAGSGVAVPVDEETDALLGFAGQLHALSDGLFDITSGVLRQAWDFRAARLPDAARLRPLLSLIGWQQVRREGTLVALPKAGMELDFGGFGKEYAADRAAGVLAEAGMRHGFVNLGGDIRVLGARRDATLWRFGIQHPRDAHATLAHIDLSEGALATSGDYERYFEVGGHRYCHILDPRTGWPVSAQPDAWASASVVAPACVAAGALSTIAMLKGRDAPAFLATQQARCLLIDPQLHAFQPGPSDGHPFLLGASA